MTRFVPLLAILLTLTGPAQAREICAPLPEFLDMLRDKYREWVVMTADAATHRVFLTASDAGTWSLLRVTGTTACLVGAGRNAEWLKGV